MAAAFFKLALQSKSLAKMMCHCPSLNVVPQRCKVSDDRMAQCVLAYSTFVLYDGCPIQTFTQCIAPKALYRPAQTLQRLSSQPPQVSHTYLPHPPNQPPSPSHGRERHYYQISNP